MAGQVGTPVPKTPPDSNSDRCSRQVGLGVIAGGALIALVGTIETEMPGLQGDLSLGQFTIVVAYAIFMLGVCFLACVVRTRTRRALSVEPTVAHGRITQHEIRTLRIVSDRCDLMMPTWGSITAAIASCQSARRLRERVCRYVQSDPHRCRSSGWMGPAAGARWPRLGRFGLERQSRERLAGDQIAAGKVGDCCK